MGHNPFEKIALAVAAGIAAIIAGCVVGAGFDNGPIAGIIVFVATAPVYVVAGGLAAELCESIHFWALPKERFTAIIKLANDDKLTDEVIQVGTYESYRDVKAKYDALPADAKKMRPHWKQNVRLLVAAGWPVTIAYHVLILGPWGLIDRLLESMFPNQ